jgi:hypothetical protein
LVIEGTALTVLSMLAVHAMMTLTLQQLLSQQLSLAQQGLS